MTPQQRSELMDEYEELTERISSIRQEIWDAECGDDDCEAEALTDELLTVQSKRRSVLEQLPESRQWPELLSERDD